MSSSSSKVSKSSNYTYPEVDTNFNFKYIIKSHSDLLKVIKVINENDWASGIELFNTSPNEYLFSIRAYPFDATNITNTASSTNELKIANTTLTVTGATLYPMPSVLQFYNIGTWRVGYFDFDRNNSEYFYNNFLDYYFSITVWLPYIDFIELPIEKILNKRVTFDYAIDFDTGKCNCYVNISDLNTFLNQYTLAIFQGTIGVDIPFSQTNANERGRDALLNAIGVASGAITSVVGIATGNPLMTLAGIGTEAISGIKIWASQQHKLKSSMGIYNRNIIINPQNIYFIIDKPNPINVEDYAHFRGKPCCKTLTLGDLTGFTKVGKIHLTNFSEATKQELDEIEELLEEGVIL